MCSHSRVGQRNQFETRKLLRQKSHRDNDVVKASLSQKVLSTRPFTYPAPVSTTQDLLRHRPFPEPNALYPSSAFMLWYIIVTSSGIFSNCHSYFIMLEFSSWHLVYSICWPLPWHFLEAATKYIACCKRHLLIAEYGQS